jgi:hypothetical protein
LGARGGSKDGAGILLQDFEPVVHVAGVVGVRLVRDAEAGAQERGADLGAALRSIGFGASALGAVKPSTCSTANTQ